MRVLFYVSPFDAHGIPLNYVHGALGKLSAMASGLKTYGARVEVLTSGYAAQVMRERDADVFRSCDRLWLMDEEDVAGLGPGSDTGVGGADLFTAATPNAARLNRARAIMSRLGLTEDPDHVISMFAETGFLRELFPGSLVTFFETGLVSHLPFRQFHVLDPVGTYRDGAWFTNFSDAALLKSAEALTPYAPILDRIREGFGGFSDRFIGELGGHKAVRGGFRKVVLIPLQVMGNPSVDHTVPFSSPFQFLEYVLRRLPPDIGAVVSEHPMFPQITGKQHAYLQEVYENYLFSPQQQRIWSPSAILLPVVDAVIGISSTVLLQAHAMGIRTHSVGSSSFVHLNSASHLEDFAAALSEDRPFRDRRLAVLNIVSRYSVPMSLYTTPWLGERLAQTRRAPGIEAEKPVTDLPFIAPPAALAAEYKPRGWPAKLEKPSSFLTHGWDAAPLSLNRTALPAPIPEAGGGPAGDAPTLRVAVVLDHYAVGGTQRVVQRLVDLMPDVEWVIFVEKLTETQFPLKRNARLVRFGPPTAPEAWSDALVRAMYKEHAKSPISLFLDPMHWRTGALLSAPLVKKVLGIPVIYWEHNSYFFPQYNGKIDLHQARESILDEVDHTVVLNPRDRAHFAAVRPDLPVTVIANPVPVIPSEAGDTASSRTILVLGRFDPQKRMDRLVPIMRGFHKRHPSWKMVVLGEGAARQPLIDQARREGLEKVMSFPGYCAEPEPYLRDAAVVAVVSDYEGDPLVIMEAKAHGLPVVAFELFQNTRLRDGVDGYYVTQGDIEGFVERLSALAGSDELRHRLGEAGRAHYQSYDNREVARTWRRLFDEVIAGTATGTPCEGTLEHGELMREAVHVMAAQAWKMEEMFGMRMQSLRAELAAARKTQKAEEALKADRAALEQDRVRLRQREEELASAVSKANARADAEARKARELGREHDKQKERANKLARAYRQSPRYLASLVYRKLIGRSERWK